MHPFFLNDGDLLMPWVHMKRMVGEFKIYYRLQYITMAVFFDLERRILAFIIYIYTNQGKNLRTIGQIVRGQPHGGKWLA
jgi:hypothetical protein